MNFAKQAPPSPFVNSHFTPRPSVNHHPTASSPPFFGCVPHANPDGNRSPHHDPTPHPAPASPILTVPLLWSGRGPPAARPPDGGAGEAPRAGPPPVPRHGRQAHHGHGVHHPGPQTHACARGDAAEFGGNARKKVRRRKTSSTSFELQISSCSCPQTRALK